MSRVFDPAAFEKVYEDVILNNEFFEGQSYYKTFKGRYKSTVEVICKHVPEGKIRILEVGGGMIGLILQELYGDEVTVADLSAHPSETITKHGASHMECDLLRDRWDGAPGFDLVLLAEVVEHLPLPLYDALERLSHSIVPGGSICITTPNMHRIRNVIHLLLGKEIFCPLVFPERGSSIGHPFEFHKRHLEYHLDRAGFDDVRVWFDQLDLGASSAIRKLARRVASLSFKVVPRWQDNLVAVAKAPQVEGEQESQGSGGRFVPDEDWSRVAS